MFQGTEFCSSDTPFKKKLAHGFISSRLGFCNSLFTGITGKNIRKPQYIENSAASILMRVWKYNPTHSTGSFRIDSQVDR
ncbi:hypothetical protein EYF80_033282 [Liparis tanakae]|uniref:Uncharacterized protein n=1 Tax=Liparis tanakae TaxID=230148 RepID=A0A4Z2GTN5_9TELE|nr:hypothetical protein EYF80_033282 [Liparis tanakae]